MKLRYKITIGIAAVFTLSVLVFMLVLSHTSACGPAPALSGQDPTMKAITARCYGSPDILEFADAEKPVPADDEILVKVHAASVNPLDWHYMRGTPYVIRMFAGIGAPEDPRVGVDFSGTVESVGKNVSQFEPGDEVFGGANGAFADYVVISADRAVIAKPDNVTHEQAAAVPIAAITALQALRDSGKLKAGDKVLINGASGGVGTFAVQIAKSFGAEVTGVCSTRNLEMVRSIGADHVIDYKNENYTEGADRYDLIVDMVANHSLTANRQVLKPDGIMVLVGGEKGNWIAPFKNSIKAPLLSKFIGQEIMTMLAHMRKDDLTVLAELMQNGQITSVIDSRFPLKDAAAAVRHSENGHASGKIIIEVSGR